MAITLYLEILLLLLFSSLLYIWSTRRMSTQSRSKVPTYWPVVGMLPGLLWNVHRVNDFTTYPQRNRPGGTFIFKGPWFANVDMMITVDPTNIKHILSKNYSNYPKGPEHRKSFDILGDGIFNSDFELWRFLQWTPKIIFSLEVLFNTREIVETCGEKNVIGLNKFHCALQLINSIAPFRAPNQVHHVEKIIHNVKADMLDGIYWFALTDYFLSNEQWYL